MQEVFEKIIESFSSIHRVVKNDEDLEWNRAVWKCTEIVKKEAEQYNNGWIPADEPPKDDNYVLLSFENYSLPSVGRYQEDAEGGGAYYIGDCSEEDTCIANKLFVNAWRPLPESYQQE